MALTMKSSAAVSSAARAARPSRATVVVRAEARREVLAGFVAAGAALLAAPKAQANTAVDLFDDRKARDTGFDIIYEARDLDLPQSKRDGLDQARQNLDLTIKRVKESESRIDSAIKPSVDKAYWTEAREELRRQVGTLRFDLNTLASTKPKEAKKEALAARKEFIRAVEDLDFALRKKDQDSAAAKLVAVQTSLDKALAKLL